MKRFLAGFVTAAVLFSVPLVFAESPVRLVVNGQEISFPDAPPQMLNNRVMVPARPLAEALGGKVTWNAETRSVIVTSGSAPHDASTAMEPFAMTVDLGSTKQSGTAIYNESGQLCLLLRTAAQVNSILGPSATKEDPAAHIMLGNASFAKGEVFTVKGQTYIPIPLLAERMSWTTRWDEQSLTLFLGK